MSCGLMWKTPKHSKETWNRPTLPPENQRPKQILRLGFLLLHLPPPPPPPLLVSTAAAPHTAWSHFW